MIPASLSQVLLHEALNSMNDADNIIQLCGQVSVFYFYCLFYFFLFDILLILLTGIDYVRKGQAFISSEGNGRNPALASSHIV